MQSRKYAKLSCTNHVSNTLYVLSRRLCSTIRWFIRRRRPLPKLVIKRLNSKKTSGFHQNTQKPIRVATFNVTLFSLAPAIPPSDVVLVHKDSIKIPKGILKVKQSPLHPKELKKVSINLPENEISCCNSAMRSPGVNACGNRTVYDVMREVDADIWTLQDVKAEEGNELKPLSELTRALGMTYVFAETWAPEYGNALLSKWPIKKWKVLRICDDKDFRNVIKATIDVPWTGEINVYSTQLDHLDEKWRIKQIKAIIESNNNDHIHKPHILAGGLNSLDASDYSQQRWNHILKYYEELGKPAPKVEVTNFLKGKGYIDAKHFAGECEPLVIIAKAQNVQGTCKYGTRVDYILGSPGLDYMFVPGSYSVVSSKGTSDHHIVKVDVLKVDDDGGRNRKKLRHNRIVKMRGWGLNC